MMMPTTIALATPQRKVSFSQPTVSDIHTPSPAKFGTTHQPMPNAPTRRTTAKRHCPFDDNPLELKHQVWDRPSAEVTHEFTLRKLMDAQRNKQDDVDDDDEFARSTNNNSERCNICNANHPTQTCTPCSFCSKGTCRSCLRQCEDCQEPFCTYCSTIDYKLRYDRYFCLDCKEEEEKPLKGKFQSMFATTEFEFHSNNTTTNNNNNSNNNNNNNNNNNDDDGNSSCSSSNNNSISISSNFDLFQHHLTNDNTNHLSHQQQQQHHQHQQQQQHQQHHPHQQQQQQCHDKHEEHNDADMEM